MADCCQLLRARPRRRRLLAALLVAGQVASCGVSKKYFREPETDDEAPRGSEERQAPQDGRHSQSSAGEKNHEYAVQAGWPEVEFEYRARSKVFVSFGILWPFLAIPAISDSAENFGVGLSAKLGYSFAMDGESGFRPGIRLAFLYYHSSYDEYGEPVEKNTFAMAALLDFGILKQWKSGLLFGLDLCPLAIAYIGGGGGVVVPPQSLAASKIYIGYSW